VQPDKILFVIDRISQPGAGTEGQLLLLMDKLHQRGVSVQLLVLRGSPWLDQATLPYPVNILGSSSVKNPWTWFRLWRWGRTQRGRGYRLAQVFFNDASVICPPVLSACGVKTLIARRDMGFWYTAFYRRILPLTGRFVTGAVVNSEAVGDVTHRVERLPKYKIHVIYNGYNGQRTRELASPEAQPELARLRADGARLLGLVANIRPIKRIEDAVAALGLLSDELPDLHLVVLGSGDPEPLRAAAKSSGVEHRLHCLGSRSDISACLSYFEAGLLCSESEGFSNAVVEYQQAGLPVVCSRTGGNPEAVVHGENGWLYPVGDVQALAQCLRELLTDTEQASYRGEQGRKLAQERYDPERMADQYLTLYGNLLTTESHPE